MKRYRGLIDFLRTLWRIVQAYTTLVGLGIGGFVSVALLSTFQRLRDAQLVVQMFVGLAIVALTAVMIRLVTKLALTALPPKLSTSRIYDDREELQRNRGDLVAELEQTATLWASWPTGAFLTERSTPEQLSKLGKIIIFHPDVARRHPWYDEKGGYDVTQTKLKEIEDVSSFLNAHNVSPLLSSWDYPSITIGDPNGPDPWVRVEILLPFTPPARWPNVVISKSSHPRAYQAILESFTELEARIRRQSAP